MIDPVCVIHGKKMSEHQCLYCCLCFKPLTIEECNTLPNGSKEDVCLDCAKEEKIMKQLNDTDLMPFGKHRGIPMQDVPASYLHYLWTSGMKHQTKTSDVADYISRNLEALKMEDKDKIWT